MSTDKKTNPVQTAEPIAAWKERKNKREQLLRAIRSKSYSDTIRNVIRSEIKKSENGEGSAAA